MDFRLGNTSAMPFDSDSFELVVCRKAFKNFSEPVRALQEMHRAPRSIDQHIERMRMAFFSRWMTRLTFRFMLLKRAYTRDELDKMLAQTKFAKAAIEDSELGFELWLSK